jgi:hypothetical protein
LRGGGDPLNGVDGMSGRRVCADDGVLNRVPVPRETLAHLGPLTLVERRLLEAVLGAKHVGHVPGQDPSQPGRLLGAGTAAELATLLVCLHERLLHDVGWGNSIG